MTLFETSRMVMEMEATILALESEGPRALRECPYLVELPQEGGYTRGCLYHGPEGIEEVDDGIDIPSYTLRFQELALMCGRMFPEESDEVEKYVSGLPDMIRGNVMSHRPQTME
ncbi:hypothetical protein Tco_0406894 [Tanacetum coccineum]